MSFETANLPLKAIVGADINTLVTCFLNKTQTESFSFAGWTVEWRIQGKPFTVSVDTSEGEGKIRLLATAEQTQKAKTGILRHALKMISPGGEVSYLWSGPLIFEDSLWSGAECTPSASIVIQPSDLTFIVGEYGPPGPENTAAVNAEKTRAETAEQTKLAKVENLKDLSNISTARSSLGLGTAATEPSTAFDAKGAAATALSTAETQIGSERTRAEAAEVSKVAKTEINVANGVLGLDANGRPGATFILGLADPLAAPYGAKCDGVTDDTAAFTRLHEAINVGTIKGYYLTNTAKIRGSLPIITRETEIRRFNNAQFDFSESTATTGISLEGSYGTHAPLTATANVGEYTISVGTAYADGTMLKIIDPTTVWDVEQKAHPAEIVEVGVPDGPLSGINGASNTPAGIKSGETITAITIAAVNAKGIFGTSGTVSISGETFSYTAVEQTESFTKLTTVEKIAEQNHLQGARVALVPAAGTVYLRIPISHELGYTVANGGYVEPLTMVGPSLIEASIRGPGGGVAFTGIAGALVNRITIRQPNLTECFQQGIRLFDCTWWRIDEPFISNDRYIAYTGGGNGYGVYIGFCSQDGEVTGGRTLRTRHSYTQGSTPANGYGLPRRNRVLDHQSISAYAAAFDSHAGANDISFIGCSALQPNGSIYSLHCPKVMITGARGTRPGGSGIAAINRTLGSTEYDFDDFDFIQPAENGVTVRSEGAEWGSNVKYIRIHGQIDTPSEYGIQVEGSGEGNTINWTQKNVDIDVTVSNGPTTGPYQAVNISSTENFRVRLQGSGAKISDDIVKLRDAKHGTVQLGPCGWAATSTGVGCRISVGAGGGEGNSSDIIVYEGPLTSRGSNSTKLETNVTNVTIYPGPDSNVSLGTGTGNKLEPVPGPESIVESMLAPLAVSAGKLAAAAVIASKLGPEAVEAAALKLQAVTTEKLAPRAVTTGKIATGAINTELLGEEVVETSKIKLAAVGALQIAGEAVETTKIKALAVTEGKIAALAVTTAKLGEGAVTAVKLAASSVESSKIAKEAVIAEKLGPEAVETAALKSLGVTAAKIAEQAIETAKIAALAVTEGKIAGAAVTAGKLASEAVETAKIKAAAVTAEKLAGESVETAKIKALAVTEGKIAEQAVSRTRLANAVSKQIPAEHGRSAEMVAGKITIAAPSVTTTGAILITTEGGTAIGASVKERKAGENFTVEATATSTDRINWAVWTE